MTLTYNETLDETKTPPLQRLHREGRRVSPHGQLAVVVDQSRTFGCS